MNELRERLSGPGLRRIAFTLVVVVPLVLYFGLFQFWRNQLLIVTSWFGGFGLLEPIFYERAHRLHEIAAAMNFWPVLVGLLAQFRSPKRHITGMLMALFGMVALAAAMVLSSFTAPLPIVAFLGVPILLATFLHPAGRELLTAFSVDRVNRVLLVLLVVAAVPMLAFTAAQIGLQSGAIEPAHDHAGGAQDEETHEAHLEFGHFMFTTAFSLGVLVTGLLASLGGPDWRLAAWVVGLMVVGYAIAGLLAPEAASNPGPLWNLGAVAWGVAFVAAGYLTAGGTPSVAARGAEPSR